MGARFPHPPKAVDLVAKIIEIGTNPDALILDSFAGSGTTAHAVLALNKKDGGNRKFILVECEEYADKLTAERVRRVIKGYKFEGTQREELLREALTWTKLKRASELVGKAEDIARFEEKNYDKVVTKVEEGELVVTGEKRITDKTDGLGGSFTYCTLGPEMTLEKLLAEGLPTYEALAKYVFFTATGQTLTELPKKKNGELGYIGQTAVYRVHLLYKPDAKWLATSDAALTEELVEKMLAANTENKRLLIFAAAKFMSQRELARHGVEFCQLPFAIHRLTGE